MFTTACALLLLLAGGLVTSNDAGLAVPDWPTSFGSLWKIPAMIGGVKYEHGHRMMAEFVGLLAIILAVWTWRTDHRPWMRKLTVLTVLGVIIQGALGGLTVLNLLPPAISTAHGTMGQAMFCVLAAIALFTSRSWHEDPVRLPQEPASNKLRGLTTAVVSVIFVQLIFGAAFRHVWTKWGPNAANRMPADDIVWYFLVPHVLNAILVCALTLWMIVVVLTHFSRIAQLRKPALLMLGLLLAQLGLGFGSYLTRVEWGVNAPQPTGTLVFFTVAHLVVGATLLAIAVVLAIQTRRSFESSTADVRTNVRAESAVTA